MAEVEAAFKDVPDISGATLPEDVRRHLGRLLAATYKSEEQGCAETDAAAHFANLLDRLEEAIGRATTRDEKEFQKLLLENTEPLRRYALSLCRDPTAAKDLVQETFMRAWRSRANFQAGTNMEAWVFTIMRNQFYTSHRKYGRELQDEDGAFAARLSTPPAQAAGLELQDVRAALDQLAAPMRETLLLVTVEHMSYDEVAVIMGCQIGTVKSRMWRARDQLAKLLGYSGSEIGTDAVMRSVTTGS